MKTLALTGSIGTGKSTALTMFAQKGVPTQSADLIVHQLIMPLGKAFDAVSTAFPEAVEGREISRKKLGEMVFRAPEKLKTLEAILHPLVQADEVEFFAKAKRDGAKMAVIEIPLLFETSGEKRFDFVATTYAPTLIKWMRVKSRPHMTKEKFFAILRRQTPDSEKRKQSNFVIHTWLGKAFAKCQVNAIIEKMECA